MNAAIHVLLVSASVSDETVLTTLLAREQIGEGVELSAAASAQAFYDALYSEQSYQVVVVDDRQAWSDWPGIIATCAKNRPDALLALLSSVEQPQESALSQGVAAVYPRNSAGLIALTKLVGKLAAQERGFSLRQEAGAFDEAEEAAEEERGKLVYAVSHDLQDPLQLARRYADILNEDFEDALGACLSLFVRNLRRQTSHRATQMAEFRGIGRHFQRGLQAFHNRVHVRGCNVFSDTGECISEARQLVGVRRYRHRGDNEIRECLGLVIWQAFSQRLHGNGQSFQLP